MGRGRVLMNYYSILSKMSNFQPKIENTLQLKDQDYWAVNTKLKYMLFTKAAILV